MYYPTYCKTCDAVTGHHPHGFESTCLKCNTVKPLPLIRWVAGILLIGGVTLFIFWITITAVLALLHAL